jgi:hypothetical protein
VGLLISLNSLNFSFSYVSAFLFDSPFLSDIQPACCIAFIVSVPSEWRTVHKKLQTQPRGQEIHKPLEAEVHKNCTLLIRFRVPLVVNITNMTLRGVMACILLERHKVLGVNCVLIRPL